MGKLLAGAAVVLLVAAGAWAGGEGDGEKKVDLSKVPKKVVSAVKKKYPEATIRGASTETDKGKKVYEIAITNKGQKIDVSLTPAGKILSVEAEVKMKDVPKAVAKAMRSKYPKAKVKLIEEVSKGKTRYYEFQLTTAEGQAVEASFDPSGKYLPPEKAAPKDDKK
jgi:uncharacterized membrane protein YkoI